jgi:hypothetical protein
MEIMQKQIELFVAVRNVNDQYIERIAEVMPVDLAATFRQKALERGYPRIYRDHGVQRLFKEAKKVEGLAPEVLTSIEQIEAAFLAELAVVNDQVRNSLRKSEPEQTAGRAGDFARRMRGENVEHKPDPTRELFLKRDDMCRGYAKQLQTAMTPDEYAKLPGAMRWIESPAEETPVRVMKPTTVPPSKNPKQGSADGPSEGGGSTDQ